MPQFTPDVLVEELWRGRLAQARSRYDAAAEELRRAIETNSDDSLQRDEWQAILEIRFREADALSEYLSALRTLGELTGEAHC